MTIFSPNTVATRADADVDVLAVDHRRELAVLRAALLDDVHAAHDLQPAGERGVDADAAG